MKLLPAIDLLGGNCVRLFRGDFDTAHQVADDPLSTARSFQKAGSGWIHMVDLDGAKDGRGKNGRIVQAVAQVGLKVELGGGIRTMADIEQVLSWGVARVVIGSAAVKDPQPELFQKLRFSPQLSTIINFYADFTLAVVLNLCGKVCKKFMYRMFLTETVTHRYGTVFSRPSRTESAG